MASGQDHVVAVLPTLGYRSDCARLFAQLNWVS